MYKKQIPIWEKETRLKTSLKLGSIYCGGLGSDNQTQERFYLAKGEGG